MTTPDFQNAIATSLNNSRIFPANLSVPKWLPLIHDEKIQQDILASKTHLDTTTAHVVLDVFYVEQMTDWLLYKSGLNVSDVAGGIAEYLNQTYLQAGISSQFVASDIHCIGLHKRGWDTTPDLDIVGSQVAHLLVECKSLTKLTTLKLGWPVATDDEDLD